MAGDGKKLIVTVELTVNDLGETEVLLLKDLLKVGSNNLALSGNFSLYDYDPNTKVVSVEIA